MSPVSNDETGQWWRSRYEAISSLFFFSVFVHPCQCRPSYSNEKALMHDWRINWMDIKRGLNPAVNVWALGCQDNTADSALKPLKAFCLWVVFMTGTIFHLGLDRAARVTVAVNLALICLLFVWCVQRGRCSRSDFSPQKRHFYFPPRGFCW